MTDGHGHTVGGIVGLWNAIEIQEHAHHLLHLRLGCFAVSGNGLLDDHRLVLVDRSAHASNSQDSDAASLPYDQGCGHVPAKEELFHGDCVRPMLEKERLQLTVER
jgi:hypothetical protein